MKLKYRGFLRISVVGLVSIAQLVLLAVLVIILRQNYIYVYVALEIMGLIEVLLLSDKNQSSAYTIAWIIVILILPVFGIILYLLWGRTTYSRKSKRTREIILQSIKYLIRTRSKRKN